MHRERIDVNMLQRNLRIGFGHASDDASPELRGLQHVGFVNGCQFEATLFSEFERDTRYALNLGFAVAHRVPRRARAGRIATARLAKVEPAKKFAYKKNVRSCNNRWAKRRALGQGVVRDRRTQIGKAAESNAQLQQARFGTTILGKFVPF